MPLDIMPGLSIDDDRLEITHLLASGPGGQNVQKTFSAVQLRFDAAGCAALPPALFQRLERIAGHRMTSAGVIVLTGQRFRSQMRNIEDVRERLAELIREAAEKPRFRVPTRPSRSARRRRVDDKTHRGGIKRNRQTRIDD
ncbi:alternative ribosome rescue aminoacyl-tRNA hydrolase ArfB [Brytella acorum]|uniref:Alternative ribosome rescue aminoacyl-tRNA hydrolase ArfB n=1 Tax=Brytella acorum TaxID=2959299 RepID=A0AA35UJB8_9PROT|nr:alternative ribosome rescue aminoacyl-tRNA hydrolase ArfB [Brytella acorum]MDF3623474.1 alternative ribosome rescue aminoacyl-tRNA hydrolase ArfB [Brytella acorum]CAI9121394.1 alternative ribosome rescue aminoacyl-tRNA hydrolase ArfB [Brytella acorum]